MKLMPNEVIMLGRQMSHGQMWPILQLFFNTEKIA